jgi:hypothetical protein
MRTSTAEANGYRCPSPDCGDAVTKDPSGKGFVRHSTNADCGFERGERD